MFAYTDPAGRAFLGDAAVALAYQQRLQGVYEQFARRPRSAFTWLEAFDHLSGNQAPTDAAVPWLAFPLLSANVPNIQIDDQRSRLQDEYVEWRVERDQATVTRITFTTEFPEYFMAFAEVGTAQLIAAVHDAVPAANPTVAELFGSTSDPDQLPPMGRINRFLNQLPNNPWNNGQKGILCLPGARRGTTPAPWMISCCPCPQTSGRQSRLSLRCRYWSGSLRSTSRSRPCTPTPRYVYDSQPE
jgi:hypothetical protein